MRTGRRTAFVYPDRNWYRTADFFDPSLPPSLSLLLSILGRFEPFPIPLPPLVSAPRADSALPRFVAEGAPVALSSLRDLPLFRFVRFQNGRAGVRRSGAAAGRASPFLASVAGFAGCSFAALLPAPAIFVVWAPFRFSVRAALLPDCGARSVCRSFRLSKADGLRALPLSGPLALSSSYEAFEAF